MTPHHLDWQNQPSVFKDYPGITPLPLPSEVSVPDTRLSSLLKREEKGERSEELDVADLSLLLRLAHTLTARARSSGGDYYFRSVASAGALYPTELYVAARGLEGVQDGLYHFAVHRHCLYPIRLGAVTPPVAGHSQTPDNRTPHLTFFLTAIFFRTAWKYRDRSYRYHLLDTGHLVENLALALRALRIPFRVSYDFDDARVNELLGLDTRREVCLALIHGPGGEEGPLLAEERVARVSEEVRGASRVSAREVDYPEVREFHQTGSKVSPAAAPALEMHELLGVAPGVWREMALPSHWPEVMSYAEALFTRRSRRNFLKQPLTQGGAEALMGALRQERREGPSEGSAHERALAVGLLAERVEGMQAGFYLLHRAEPSAGLITPGPLLESMAHVCLDQLWLGHAALHFVFLSNLEVLDQTWGARGYRYAMLNAGRLGQRLYLAATAMGLGCCGIGAFYDAEASQLLGLNRASRLLYLVAVGPVKSKIAVT